MLPSNRNDFFRVRVIQVSEAGTGQDFFSLFPKIQAAGGNFYHTVACGAEDTGVRSYSESGQKGRNRRTVQFDQGFDGGQGGLDTGLMHDSGKFPCFQLYFFPEAFTGFLYFLHVFA